MVESSVAIKEHIIHVTLGSRFHSIRVFEDLDSSKFYLPSFKEPPPTQDPKATTARMLEAIVNHEDITSYSSLNQAVDQFRQTAKEPT